MQLISPRDTGGSGGLYRGGDRQSANVLFGRLILEDTGVRRELIGRDCSVARSPMCDMTEFFGKVGDYFAAAAAGIVCISALS